MVAHPHSQRAKKQKEQKKRERSASLASSPIEALPREKSISARRLRQRRARRRHALVGGGIVLGIGVLAWLGLRPGPELPGVERPANDGRGHVAAATYDDAAPTSGEHNASAPACGLYRTPLAPDLAVHALEHGTVLFWYDAARPELADELISMLEAFDSHVIVSSNENLTAPVVATAWNRRLELDGGGEEALSFADTYRRRGPEQVPCDITA